MHCLVWFLLFYLLHLLRLFCSFHKFIAILIFYLNTIWIYEFFKRHPERGVFCYVNLSNLENVLERNLRTDKTGEYIFWASGGTNFEKFSAQCQPWWRICEFHVCTGLPKKSLDTSLVAEQIRHWLVNIFARKHELPVNLVYCSTYSIYISFFKIPNQALIRRRVYNLKIKFATCYLMVTIFM